MRPGVLRFALVLVLLCWHHGGVSDAYVPPLDAATLAELATRIVEGTVSEVTRMPDTESGPGAASHHYQAVVMVRSADKGDLAVGARIRVAFTVASTGPHEDGPQPAPDLFPCERVRLFLFGLEEPYLILYPNGKQVLEPPERYLRPDHPGHTVRCGKP